MPCSGERLGEGEIGQGLALDMHLVRLAAAGPSWAQLDTHGNRRINGWVFIGNISTGNHGVFLPPKTEGVSGVDVPPKSNPQIRTMNLKKIGPLRGSLLDELWD